VTARPSYDAACAQCFVCFLWARPSDNRFPFYLRALRMVAEPDGKVVATFLADALWVLSSGRGKGSPQATAIGQRCCWRSRTQHRADARNSESCRAGGGERGAVAIC
jgi:hypothetical protein